MLFYNIAWYLAYEEWHMGQEHGLTRTERLDRLSWVKEDYRFRRNEKPITDPFNEWSASESVGIFFGENSAQLVCATPYDRVDIFKIPANLMPEWSFAFIREASEKFPEKQIRYSKTHL